jgi:hypothetical protein
MMTSASKCFAETQGRRGEEIISLEKNETPLTNLPSFPKFKYSYGRAVRQNETWHGKILLR